MFKAEESCSSNMLSFWFCVIFSVTFLNMFHINCLGQLSLSVKEGQNKRSACLGTGLCWKASSPTLKFENFGGFLVVVFVCLF